MNQIKFDLKGGDQCSKIAYDWAQKTHSLREGRLGSRGDRQVDEKGAGGFAHLIDLNGLKIGITSDGIGTKIEIAERMKKYSTLGFDLVAMVTDDLICQGIEPVSLSNILDVNRLDPGVVNGLMEGLCSAAQKARLIISGGETAELGERVGGYGEGMHFSWCATCVGVLPPGRTPIDGAMVRPGDEIISLKSPNFRSNGFTVIRKILEKKFGNLWHEHRFKHQTWGEILLSPSLIYAPIICLLLDEGVNLHGISHITGGSFEQKLGRVLRKTALGARLDSLFDPLPYMQEIIRLGDLPPRTAYQYWNMGNGMLLIADPGESDGILKTCQKQGFEAQRAGQVTKSPGIEIRPEWLGGETFTYPQ